MNVSLALFSLRERCSWGFIMSARKEIITERLNELFKLAREAEMRGESAGDIDAEIRTLKEEFTRLSESKQLLKG